MAVGDVFKKRRNLVQSAASKPRAGYGARVNAFKVEPTGNPMRDWAEAERAATGSINRMQPGQAGQAWGQAQRDWAEQERGATLGWGEQPATRQADVFQLTGNAGGPRSFNPQNPGNANFIFGVDDRDDNGNPMRPQDAIVNVQDGEDPDPNGYSLIPPSMTGTYKQNQPVYFQGVDPRTGQVSRVPISHKQMSAFNNPFLGSGDMGRPEDGSIAPVAGGPRSFNPQNQGVSARASAAPANRPSPTAERTEWDALGDLNAEDPSWVLRRRAERTLGDQVRGMMDQNSQEPRALNPQNQDVLARAAAALDAVKQDRLNPMGTTRYTDDQINEMQSQSEGRYPSWMPKEALATLATARLNDIDRDSQNQDVLARAAAALDAVKQDRLNPGSGALGLRGFTNSVGQGPVPRSVASQAPNYYQQQAAGMDVESIRRRELAGQIDALRQRSQRDNPMAPRQPYDPMQDGIVQGRRQDQFMSIARIAGSSGEAGVTARSIPGDLYNPITARPANRYDGMVQSDRDQTRMTPNEKLELAERSAGRYMQGGAAADPTNMRGRFGGAYGTGLNADATAIAEGRAVRTADGKVVYHTGTQESARAAQVAGKTEREALRDRNNMNVPQAELNRRAAADAQKAARAAKHQAFKDANGGMSYRQYDRMTGSSNGNNALTMKAVREGRLSPEEANYRMQLRAEKALRRSGNPVTGGTSQAGRFFPDQMAGRGGQQAPAAPLGNPIFGPGAPNTVENVNARVTARQANVQSSPTLSAWGVSPDLDPSGFAQAVGQNLFPRQPDGKFGFAEVSDDGIKSIFNQVKLFDPTGDGKPPFPEGSIYNQMWGLPEDTPPAELRKMFEAMLANMNAVPQAPVGQAGQGSWASQGKM